MRRTKVDIPTEDGVADTYLVRPDGDGPFPGVLFFMDAFGLRPRLKEMADRIAERGYAVLAPNLLYRGGRSPQVDPAALATRSRGQAFEKVMPMMPRWTPRDHPGHRGLPRLLRRPGRRRAGPGGGRRLLHGRHQRAVRDRGLPGPDQGDRQLPRRRLATDQPDSPHLRVGEHHRRGVFRPRRQRPLDDRRADRALERALDEAGVRTPPRSTRARRTASRCPTRPCTTRRPRSATGSTSSSCWTACRPAVS